MITTRKSCVRPQKAANALNRVETAFSNYEWTPKKSKKAATS